MLGLRITACLFLAVGGSNLAWAKDPPYYIDDALRALLYPQQNLLRMDSGDTAHFVKLENNQDPRYNPANHPIFAVKTYWIDESRIDAYLGDNLTADLRKTLVRTLPNGRKQYLLFVHPESERFYQPLTRRAQFAGLRYASPFASGRTLLILPRYKGDKVFFAKVSLDAVLSSDNRIIDGAEVVHSIGINNVLHADRQTMPTGIEVQPEVFGLVPKELNGKGGMLVRTIPDDVLSGRRHLTPLFALLTDRPDGRPPMLADMIRRSGKPGSEYLRQHLLRPLVRRWLDLAMDHDVVGEDHEQNVQAGLDDQGMLDGTFSLNDLGGFHVDLADRDRRGLPRAAHLPVVHGLAEDYHLQHLDQAFAASLGVYVESSLIYDLAKLYPHWVKQRWVPRERLPQVAISRMLREEFTAYYQEKTGLPIPVPLDFSRVGDLLRAGRQATGQATCTRDDAKLAGGAG